MREIRIRKDVQRLAKMTRTMSSFSEDEAKGYTEGEASPKTVQKAV